MSQDVSARLRRVEQQVRSFKELHQSELQLILDELTDIAKQIDEENAAANAPAAADPADPAASSAKRAKWLAEQEKKTAPKSRRELLFGDRERGT